MTRRGDPCILESIKIPNQVSGRGLGNHDASLRDAGRPEEGVAKCSFSIDFEWIETGRNSAMNAGSITKWLAVAALSALCLLTFNPGVSAQD